MYIFGPYMSPASPPRHQALVLEPARSAKRERGGDPDSAERQPDKFHCLPAVPDLPLHLGALFDREQYEEMMACALLESPDQTEHIFGPTPLDAQKVREGRMKELQQMIGVYELRPAAYATSKNVFKCPWVDQEKGDEVRSRRTCCDYNTQ